MALPDSSPDPVIQILKKFLQHGEQWLKSSPTRGNVMQLSRLVRSQLGRIYGTDSPELIHFPILTTELPEHAIRPELSKRIEQLRQIIAALEALPRNFVSPTRGKRIYIGHGRSPLWRELKDFVADRLRLPWDEFNRESVAGISTLERLETMCAEPAFGFLVMTAEEQHADDSVHARPNVIHEVGLFQGSLGSRRAIVMLEEGCSEFSNIIGVSQIRFPSRNIAASFEDVRRVLEREGLIRA